MLFFFTWWVCCHFYKNIQTIIRINSPLVLLIIGGSKKLPMLREMDFFLLQKMKEMVTNVDSFVQEGTHNFPSQITFINSD